MDSRIYSSEMIENMRTHLNSAANRFITHPKFVFLCGAAYSDCGYENTNRGIVDKYLRKMSEDIFIVLSEKLWEDSFESNIDLLTFEEFLAEVSDSIIIFVESPGSFCELGAFSYAEKLFSEKMIIVIDNKYKGNKSFIMTGPVAKAREDGAKVVYAPLKDAALLSSFELRSVLNDKVKDFKLKNHILNKRSPNQIEDNVHLNSFILELLELIKILQPISRRDLIEVYKRVKNFSSFKFVKHDNTSFHNEIKIDYILKLLDNVALIEINNNIITSKSSKLQPLMFAYSVKAENKERNRLLCRKYRYRGL